MKYIVTGSLGHISKPLTQQLIKAGHEVTVISNNPDNSAAIEKLGASAAIGSVEDPEFLLNAFKGADAAYTMVPPFFGSSNWKQQIADVGKNYAEAIKSAGIKHVVNLSSIGAHMPEGCGPVSGLYQVEKALNALEEVHVKHLRPGFYFYNFLNNAGMVKYMGIIGGNYGADTEMLMADPKDIAEVAAQELLDLSFTGKSNRYIISDERSTHEIARVLGQAIDKPDLTWVDFTDDATLGAMLQNGLPEDNAKNYTEMGTAIRSGEMFSHYRKQGFIPQGKIRLEHFAPVFAEAFAKA
ncbi:NmrA family NAD(P)-binding protein [Pedobacter sp. P351]|uniref:NmrA family NAD(P)-binding protein n=1 Tax=Pedobacter superstes TaxID=3133441 RepID=UPI003097886B